MLEVTGKGWCVTFQMNRWMITNGFGSLTSLAVGQRNPREGLEKRLPLSFPLWCRYLRNHPGIGKRNFRSLINMGDSWAKPKNQANESPSSVERHGQPSVGLRIRPVTSRPIKKIAFCWLFPDHAWQFGRELGHSVRTSKEFLLVFGIGSPIAYLTDLNIETWVVRYFTNLLFYMIQQTHHRIQTLRPEHHLMWRTFSCKRICIIPGDLRHDLTNIRAGCIQCTGSTSREHAVMHCTLHREEFHSHGTPHGPALSEAYRKHDRSFIHAPLVQVCNRHANECFTHHSCPVDGVPPDSGWRDSHSSSNGCQEALKIIWRFRRQTVLHQMNITGIGDPRQQIHIDSNGTIREKTWITLACNDFIHGGVEVWQLWKYHSIYMRRSTEEAWAKSVVMTWIQRVIKTYRDATGRKGCREKRDNPHDPCWNGEHSEAACHRGFWWASRLSTEMRRRQQEWRSESRKASPSRNHELIMVRSHGSSCPIATFELSTNNHSRSVD